MLCFEVKINGELSGTVGFEDAYAVGIDVSMNQSLDPNVVSIEGYGSKESETQLYDQLKWFKSSLRAGDEITISVVRRGQADAPIVTKYNEGVIDGCLDPEICSVCGKAQFEIEQLIVAPKISLCGDCVQLINDLANEQ